MIENELDVLERLLLPSGVAGSPAPSWNIIELGCGAAGLARRLLERWPACSLLGLEVDERQHAKNLASPAPAGLSFMLGGAQSVPLPDASFDLAWMLKSLHHVPLDLMAQALDETHRLLAPGGHLYVSEPVYDGALNQVIRLFNDEGRVRAAAQAALDAAIASGRWQQVAELRFAQTARYASVAEFEMRMMFPTFADHHIDEHKLNQVRHALAPQVDADGGLHFIRPMHVRLLRRLG